jgi:hypothetical protein
MKSSFGLAVLATALLVTAEELPKNEALAAEKYDNGLVHEMIMKSKHVSPLSVA